jgi:hypothetical protein
MRKISISISIAKIVGLLLLVVSFVGMGSKGFSSTSAFLRAVLEGPSVPVEPGDWTPPTVPQGLQVAVGHEDGGQILSCGDYTNSSQVKITWNANDEDDFDHYMLLIDDGSVQVNVDDSTQYFDSFTDETTRSYSLIAVDAEGLESPAGESCLISYDVSGPEVSLHTSVNENGVAADGIKLSAGLSDSNLLSYEFSGVNSVGDEVSGLPELTEAEQNELSAEVSWDSNAYDDGVYSFKVEAVDAAGNTSQATAQVILDNTAPESAVSVTLQHASSAESVIANSSFESGLDGWNAQGDVTFGTETDQYGVKVNPVDGSKMAGFGVNNSASSDVSVISQTLDGESTTDVNSIGFWYNMVAGDIDDNSGLMVFVGEEMVYQVWADDLAEIETTDIDEDGWKYLVLDVSAVADKSISFTYYRDNSVVNNSVIFIDQVTTNPAAINADSELTITASDANTVSQAHYAYTLNGSEKTGAGENPLTFKTENRPDDGKVRYWAVDEVGNTETAKVITLAEEQVETIDVAAIVENNQEVDEVAEETEQETASSSASTTDEVTEDAEQVLIPSATLSQGSDNNIQILLENLTDLIRAEYTLIYSHSVEADSDEIQEAVLSGFDIPEDAETATQDIYLGTCSSSAGTVCVPHLNITAGSLELELSNSAGDLIQLQTVFDGVWVNPVSEQEESNNE